MKVNFSSVAQATSPVLMSITLVLPNALKAQDFTYITNNGRITITRFACPENPVAITIPTTINGLPVTSIGSYAFLCSNLVSVIIPDSVTEIGNVAFYYCTGLTNVTIGNRVTRIGYSAFNHCTSLTSITIPASVTDVGWIPWMPFYSCDNLDTIVVDPFNRTFSSIDGVVFNKSGTSLRVCPGGRAGIYTVPNGVTNIADSAFSYCKRLGAVVIPGSVARIEDGAFRGCSGLTNIAIGDGVTMIGGNAFENCTSLVSAVLPDSIRSIYPAAFAGCASLKNFTIPKGVNFIGSSVFAGCRNLSEITVDQLNTLFSDFDGVLFDKDRKTLIQYPPGKSPNYAIPDGVTNISASAFSRCDSLLSVAMPDSLTSIGDFAFYYCTNLTNISMGNGVRIMGEYAFALCQTLLSVTIPPGVTTIRDGAFRGCDRLASVIIPVGVVRIGDYAFSECLALEALFFKGNAPRTGVDLFDSTTYVTVYYLPGTSGWNSTLSDRPTALWFLPRPTILDFGPSFGVQSNRFGFIISWATNASVAVETCTNLGNPVWTALATNSLTAGWSYFNHPEWTNYSAGFYRLRSP